VADVVAMAGAGRRAIPGAGRRAPPADPGLRLRIAEPAQARAELAKVYDMVYDVRPGFFGDVRKRHH
jgi:hypothetical protein